MSQICLVSLFNKKTNKGQKTLCPIFVSCLDDMLKLVFLIKRQTRDKINIKDKMSFLFSCEKLHAYHAVNRGTNKRQIRDKYETNNWTNIGDYWWDKKGTYCLLYIPFIPSWISDIPVKSMIFFSSTMDKYETNTRQIRDKYETNTRQIRGKYETKKGRQIEDT